MHLPLHLEGPVLSLATWLLSQGDAEDIRLPEDFLPTHYDLAIKTDLKAEHFWGVEEISLRTIHPSDHLVLHAGCNLNIDLVTVCQNGCRNVTAHRDCERSLLVVPVERIEGDVQLLLRWDAALDGSKGYIPSPDVGFDTPGISAVTRFEPIGARTTFPCFDQPEPKASVRMHMISRVGTTSLANMNVEKESAPHSKLANLLVDEDGWMETVFHPTPKMSMYNVAWGNGRFNALTNTRHTKIPSTVWANYKDLSGFAHLLETIQRAAAIYADKFQLPFPLPKLDWMATPAFGGGIEHWGLVTSGSEAAMWKGNGSDPAKSSITSFASHEIAHQWFGDAVTMKWWDDTWLNEAFASYAADGIVGPMLDQDFETWHPWSDTTIEGAIHADALRSHPIQLPIDSEADFSTAFDQITYMKGSSVLRMFANVVGEDDFIAGVGSYLRKYTFGNTVGAQLWDEIDQFVSLPSLSMGELARPWVTQAGLPVVHVEHLGGDKYRLSQERFFAICAESDNTWPIPLFAGDHLPKLLLDRAIEVRSNQLPILNQGRLGFYRTHYDHATFFRVRKAFNNKMLAPVDRATFLYDSTAFAQSGLLPTTAALDLIRNMKDADSSIWAAADAFIARLQGLFWDDVAMQAALGDFGRGLVSKTWEELGLEDVGEPITRKLRKAVLLLAERSDLPSLVQAASEYLYEPYPVSEDTHASLLRLAVRHGGVTAWEKAHAIWEESDKISSKSQQYFVALTSATEPQLVQRNLDLLATEKDVLQYRLALALTKRPAARSATFDWLLTNFDAFFGILPDITRARLVIDTLSTATSPQDRERIQKTFSSHPGFDAYLTSVYDNIDIAIDWLGRDGDDIRMWFGI